ncbi:MAG TPA: hypothetical protein DD827_11300 [Gammaproteobacteria bacterium]|nr:hypothetical protein [Gammaproteobacteria bacterium]
MKLFALLLSSSLALSACVSTTTPTSSDKPQSGSSEGRFSGSPRKALEAVRAQGGINVEVALGRAGGKSSSGYQTGFFNMTSAYDTIEQPFQVTIALDNSPAAQKLRASAKPIFIYVKPQISYTRVFNKDNRTTTKLETVNFPDHSSSCDGFRMVLNQGNNYRVEVRHSQRVTIREKSSGADFGVWGTHGGSDWQVTGAEGAGKLVVADLEVFYVGSENNYGTLRNLSKPEGNLKPYFVGRDRVCTYTPHRAIYRALIQ